jgi:hypothetical protein
MERLRTERTRARLTPVGRLTTVALLALVALAGARARAQNFSDSGTFEIRAEGKVVGTEKFKITRSGSNWDSTAELALQMGDAESDETAALRLNSSMRPEEYLRSQKSPNIASLAVRFGEKETSLVATSGKESAERIFYLQPGFLIILDTNFFHHYTFLLRQYTRSQGGEQPFNVFIPQEALPGTVNLTLVSQQGEHDLWKVSTDELELEIVASDNGAIQKISIPSAGVEVVRK